MIILRRRLIFWLIKAYIKKSGKTIILSFLVGLVIFFGFAFTSQYANKFIPFHRKINIGVVGAFTQDNLPTPIVNRIAEGLTVVSPNGNIMPGIASSWKILDNGRTYRFTLNKELTFSDGSQVTSDKINYNFSDVTIERPNKSTIVFKLKDSYSPFLITVSRPVFENGSFGVGSYQIIDTKVNSNFIQSLTLRSIKNRFDIVEYIFYPTEDALKLAYSLGEINEAMSINTITFNQTSFAEFKHTQVKNAVDYSHLVTLFYNNQDKYLSDKKFRLALAYALPNSYASGEKAHLPYSPKSIYYNPDVPIKKYDTEHAKLLLSESSESSNPKLQITLTTTHTYRQIADILAKSWKHIGVDTNIHEVNSVPTQFQLFLGEFVPPPDPDQYTLWHSDQGDNITRYKNLRIDKLLEDGRKTVDITERKKIYYDFQKYLMEDEPASFLFFPYQYDLMRK